MLIPKSRSSRCAEGAGRVAGATDGHGHPERLLSDQVLTPGRALREFARVRAVSLDAGDTRIGLITRRSSLQPDVLEAFAADTTEWSRARIA